ncbi:transcription initiation factor TFIIB [Halalkaliarchaeum desulfuricum]|uniref:Transcription initiation factor IIB n=1 Tax=Halalkaliarchaeum desulfuricum TaxID=2055893 RepID=A0A343TNH9_9EURY|nr:TFIIB-type zinc ribbon-containing protein [Halalkaliarchaeum desulfuricum]AUX10651.1 transcription initiation factor TFIIB [Halalkaliarchaeum desulfuricum]
MTNTPTARTADTESTKERQRENGSREQENCPECAGPLVVREDDGETVCDDCGLVTREGALDSGPEWRAYDAAERDEKSRVGAPSTELLHDRGLSTTIGWDDRDANGRTLGSRKRRKLARLRLWDERFRTKDAHDRNLKHALGEIDRMASALGLPDPVRETACVTYRRALNDDLLPGRSIEGMATAALYAAARLDGVARSIDEVTAVSRVGGMEVKRTYRYLSRELELEVPPTHPAEYLGRFASDLDCTDETERRARELVDAATDRGVHSGKHPVGIAASALYAAATLTDEEVTQYEVSDVANVSEVTIRNRYREVLEAAATEGVADDDS